MEEDNMQQKKIACILVAAVTALAAGTAAAQGAGWKPSKNVEIVVASGAGGASDRTARVLQRLLQENPAFPSITVTNRPGGGGTVAWTYLGQRTEDPHYIATFSSTMLTNHALGVGKLSHRDFTPLSILIREYPVMVVKADSPIASTKDLAARLKKDPGSVSFAFAAARGNHNHILIGMIAQAVGADPKATKVVILKSGREGTTHVLGGHVDVLVGSPGTSVPLVESGQLRALGISAPARQTGRVAGIPTFREQGFDAVFSSWRGFIAPKGLTAAQTAFWDQAFAKVVQGEDWKKDLQNNVWAEDFLASAGTLKLLESEEKIIARMLADLGVVSK
jgi:putative tricarboxylic transport membrane protein